MARARITQTEQGTQKAANMLSTQLTAADAQQTLAVGKEVQTDITKLEKLEVEVGEQRKKLNTTTNLVYLGFGALIIITAGIVVAVVIFFTQTSLDTHKAVNEAQQTTAKK